MNHFQKFERQARRHLLLIVGANNVLLVGGITAGIWLDIPSDLLIAILFAIAVATTIIISTLSAQFFTMPLRFIQQAVLHIAPTGSSIAAPKLESIKYGRELLTNIITNMYQMANVVDDVERIAEEKQSDLTHNFIATELPLPLIVLNEDQTVIFANSAALAYLQITNPHEMVGQSLYSTMDMAFQNAFTFDAWLDSARKNKPVSAQTWERVKMVIGEKKTTRLFDLAAYYNQDNPHHFETVLVIFDHTEQYSQDDQAMSLVALGVHELRTPLTLLRGYIEAFEEEIGPKLNPAQVDFMRKMSASAQQLNSFVNNILNIARVEEDQLVLKLHEQDWPPIIRAAAQDMALRSQVRGITIEIGIADGLPTVAVDKVSIYEVIMNLLDNAIKYSGKSKRIVVKTYLTQDGLVETTVQDFGVGIPSQGMANLFDKYYRNHRNRATIGGTGLGLYLSKAIVGAHGGHIWVRSKEKQGSTFGFTLQPYSKLAAEEKNSDDKAILRSAHGWIKNHSLYRR